MDCTLESSKTIYPWKSILMSLWIVTKEMTLVFCGLNSLKNLIYLKMWWSGSIFPFIYMVWNHSSAQWTRFLSVKPHGNAFFTKYVLTDEKNWLLKFSLTYRTNIIHIWTLSLAGSYSITRSCKKYSQNPSESSQMSSKVQKF